MHCRVAHYLAKEVHMLGGPSATPNVPVYLSTCRIDMSFTERVSSVSAVVARWPSFRCH
jgi:hypothetical protein